MVIIEPFVWLVSFVLKVWHLLLASVLHLPPSLSWTLSLFLLVVTVRSALAFLAFRQFVSARKQANLRPRIFMVREHYRQSVDPEAPQYASFTSKEMRKAEGLKTSAMMAPAFVQVPVIMGLVRMVRKIVRASNGPGQPATHGVGFVSQDEVSDFLNATFLGQPLPAYLRMPREQLEAIGGDYSSLKTFCLVGITTAAFFTCFNLVISWRRLRRTLDYSNSISVFMSKFMLIMIFYSPLVILFFGFFGPTPVALITYWVANNFWTLTQNIILTRYVEKNYPLSKDFHTLQDHQKSEFETQKNEEKSLKKAKRVGRLKSVIMPWKAKQFQREYEDFKAGILQRRKAKADKEYAQALEIAKVRYAVTQMRPGAQDHLPTLSKGVTISSGMVPPLPEAIKAREEKIKQAQKAAKAQKRPKPVLIAQHLTQSAGQGAKNRIKKVTGNQESQWKRFRD